jgi:hypothetical protein
MKIIKLKPFLYIVLFFIVQAGCKQETLNKPIVTNTNPPGVVSNVIVVNQNGKAVLTYSLPNNNDLLYVKAVYETSPGVAAQVVASHYTNTMIIDGFGDTLTHTIKLYAVNSSEVASAPVSVTVTPLTPGYILARRSLQVIATFGGFNFSCNNPVLDNLAIIPLVDTAGNGKYVQTVGMDNFYSNLPVITGATRNQPAIKRNYAFVVRDRWLHYSDTLVLSLTPIFEQQLDKSKWSNFVLPNDATILNNGGLTNVSYIWDGDFHPGWPRVLFTVESASTPQTVTIDLGSAHILSRMLVNPYQEVGGYYYVRGMPKDFEIWGSNTPNLSNPEPDILSDPTWTKLTTSHVVKPSGSPYQTESAADVALAVAGWPFDFPVGQAAYRYIRIRSLSNWQGSYFMNIAEFTLWGN